MFLKYKRPRKPRKNVLNLVFIFSSLKRFVWYMIISLLALFLLIMKFMYSRKYASLSLSVLLYLSSLTNTITQLTSLLQVVFLFRQYSFTLWVTIFVTSDNTSWSYLFLSLDPSSSRAYLLTYDRNLAAHTRGVCFTESLRGVRDIQFKVPNALVQVHD